MQKSRTRTFRLHALYVCPLSFYTAKIAQRYWISYVVTSIDVNYTAGVGYFTMFEYAMYIGMIDLLDLFIAAGADINYDSGYPLRMVAGRPKVVKALIRAGASVDLALQFSTPLQCRRITQVFEQVIK